MQAGITPDEQLAAQTKLALRRLASAVAVVSCRYGDMRHATTATAVNAMSMNPPSMIVCVNRATTFHGAISTAKRFAINILHRIEFNGRSVLISGDTRLNQNVIKYGAGVDLLLHEVLAVNPAVLQKVPKLMAIFNLHTSPAQCGEVFAQDKPKLAVFTHIVLMGAPAFGVPFPAPTVQDIIDETRKVYHGPLESGVDLMSFEIGDTVAVNRPM